MRHLLLWEVQVYPVGTFATLHDRRDFGRIAAVQANLDHELTDSESDQVDNLQQQIAALESQKADLEAEKAEI